MLEGLKTSGCLGGTLGLGLTRGQARAGCSRGQPLRAAWMGTLLVVTLTACGSEPTVGPGSPCGAPPSQIEPLLGELESTEGVPDLLDVGACREGRMSETLPLGSAWVALRRVDGCCEVWFGGETEDFDYDGSPQQFCRFSRSGDTLVPVFVGRQLSSALDSAGPARTCEESPACTVGLPPPFGCPAL